MASPPAAHPLPRPGGDLRCDPPRSAGCLVLATAAGATPAWMRPQPRRRAVVLRCGWRQDGLWRPPRVAPRRCAGTDARPPDGGDAGGIT